MAASNFLNVKYHYPDTVTIIMQFIKFDLAWSLLSGPYLKRDAFKFTLFNPDNKMPHFLKFSEF